MARDFAGFGNPPLGALQTKSVDLLSARSEGRHEPVVESLEHPNGEGVVGDIFWNHWETL